MDGARGLAIVLILVAHGLNYPALDSPVTGFVKKLCGFTFGGVELFFVLSGFLIGTGLMRSRRALNQFPVFYARRALRILPVYALLLLSFFLARENATLSAISSGVYFRESVPLWSYFVFFQNNLMGALHQDGPGWLVVTWSLAIEEQFYAVAPWMIRRTGPRMLLGLALFFVVACPLVRYLLLFRSLNPAGALFLTVARIDTLFLGVAVAAIWETPAWREWVRAHLRSLGWAMAVFFLFFWAGPFSAWATLPNIMAWVPTLLGLGFAGLLLWILAAPGNFVARGLQARMWVFMGGISYFVYLFHLPAIYISHGLLRHDHPALGWPGVAATLLAFVVVIGAAVASRRWLEQPLINFGHRFRHRFS